MNQSEELTVPCVICDDPTRHVGTKRCDRCWELERRIKLDLALARKIIQAIDGER